MKSYSDLIKIDSYEDRYEYLKETGKVGEDTFGYRRYLNQQFYRSNEWKKIRNQVIIRDEGCDMGHPDHPIAGAIYIHHMVPLTPEDIETHSQFLVDPEYLICVSYATHSAIHYGNSDLLPSAAAERSPNDTCPWRNN